jgi:hypothetical protein
MKGCRSTVTLNEVVKMKSEELDGREFSRRLGVRKRISLAVSTISLKLLTVAAL